MPDSGPIPPQRDTMFSEPTPEKSFPTVAVGVAAVAVVILVAVLVMVGRKPKATPETLQSAAAYAPNLAMSGIQMSQSDLPTGGKQTYIDGHVANKGNLVVTAVTLQLVFANDQAMPPQIQTVPLTLVRMRQPYVDIGPVSASPLAPGAEADFRLILEDIAPNWNVQQPEIHITQVSTR